MEPDNQLNLRTPHHRVAPSGYSPARTTAVPGGTDSGGSTQTGAVKSALMSLLIVDLHVPLSMHEMTSTA